MRRIRILHATRYEYAQRVELMPHTLHLRPREGHDIRIESSRLAIGPEFNIHWQRDVFGNSVAMATFPEPAIELAITSEVVVEHYEDQPLDFVLEEHARRFPFRYDPLEQIDLIPYQLALFPQDSGVIRDWLADLYRHGDLTDTAQLLEQINARINNRLQYTVREEPGVQGPARTLELGLGSCRDFATLLMEACRHVGLASRFVSGYLVSDPMDGHTSTHAWCEVYLPGSGWRGFDPTIGKTVSGDNIAVAVHRHPEAVPPIAGSFVGPADPPPRMSVDVQVAVL
jgi:transglutaminase-like putative cysteine protease